MAEIKLTGQMKVKTLKANFKEAFGGTLRVYKSTSCKGGFADDDATLAAIRAEGAKGGELNIVGQMQVGNFEKKIAEMYGIGIQVANADDTKLVDNSLTLGAVSRMANGEEGSSKKKCKKTAAKFTAEQLEYLCTKEFELWYYLPGQTPENSEDEEKGNCTFWITGDEIYFGGGFYSRKLNEVTDSYLDLACDVIDNIDGKEPDEVLCLNFMYNVMLRLGEYLSDLCEAAEYECQSFYYIIREKNKDYIVYEDDIVWDLSDFM